MRYQLGKPSSSLLEMTGARVSLISQETKEADRREGGGRVRSSADGKDNITLPERRGSAVS